MLSNLNTIVGVDYCSTSRTTNRIMQDTENDNKSEKDAVGNRTQENNQGVANKVNEE